MPGFRVGDQVEVRPLEQILETLDDEGRSDGMPFMPEMTRYVGGRFTVRQRAERTCVHPPEMPFRRLSACVTLVGLRCDGSAHGGCELGCMLFWKESWLRRADGSPAPAPDPGVPAPVSTVAEELPRPGREPGVPESGTPAARADDGAYVCQGTQLRAASSPGPPLWRPAQYARFVRDGTYTPVEVAAMFLRMGARRTSSLLRRRSSAARPGGRPAPLGLEAGDWVTVRSRQEIQETLDASGALGGLAFGGDMSVACGMTFQVERRVRHIMDERTGRIRAVNDTVLLRGSLCDRYLGCARGMPILWREAWLRRADHSPDGSVSPVGPSSGPEPT